MPGCTTDPVAEPCSLVRKALTKLCLLTHSTLRQVWNSESTLPRSPSTWRQARRGPRSSGYSRQWLGRAPDTCSAARSAGRPSAAPRFEWQLGCPHSSLSPGWLTARLAQACTVVIERTTLMVCISECVRVTGCRVLGAARQHHRPRRVKVINLLSPCAAAAASPPARGPLYPAHTICLTWPRREGVLC